MADSEGLNRTTIHIAGNDYTIVGTESPEHVREVGLLVDTKIRDSSKKSSPTAANNGCRSANTIRETSRIEWSTVRIHSVTSSKSTLTRMNSPIRKERIKHESMVKSLRYSH